MDRNRVFRVLYHLHTERDLFLVAQDAFSTIKLLIDQIHDLPNAITDFAVKAEGNPEDSLKYAPVLAAANELLLMSDDIIGILEPLLNEAEVFWFCCPVDQANGTIDEAVGRWRRHCDKTAPIAPEIEKAVQLFQLSIGSVLSTNFAELLKQLEFESERERLVVAKEEVYRTELFNCIPFFESRKMWAGTSLAFLGQCRFPITHCHIVDQVFAKLLGFSTARLLATPVLKLSINSFELDTVVKQLSSDYDPLMTTILFYRSSKRDVIGVHWEVCTEMINDCYTAVGVNITNEIESSRMRQAGNIQKMLRQWLHSIRNASFEQQAVVIYDEIKELQKKLNDSRFDAEFSSLADGLKILIHTAKTSVGLIDQALDTKGLVQLMPVADFLKNLSNFPHNFAQSEGIGSIFVKCVYLLNGVKVTPADLGKFFVKCDMINIQAFVDNVISNAVRYTDPLAGIEILVRLEQTDNVVNFKINIIDHCPGGLPDAAVEYLKERAGKFCIKDLRDSVLPITRSRLEGSGGERASILGQESSKDFSFIDDRSEGTTFSDRLFAFGETPSTCEQSGVSDGGVNMSPFVIEKSEEGVRDTKRRLATMSSKSSVDGGQSNKIKRAMRDRKRTEAALANLVALTRGESSVIAASSNGDESPSLSAMEISADIPARISSANEIHPSGKGRSSGTGLPHLIELYDLLTEAGDDFSFCFVTTANGTIVKLRFSGSINIPSAEPEPPRSENSMLDIRGTLLVADDSAVIRKIVAKYLNAMKIEHILCNDGAAAADWFVLNYGKCAGVLTDLEMPKMGGDALIARCKSICPEVPCFIMSGNDISIINLPSGARRSIVKPVSHEQIQCIIQEIYQYQINTA